jgi:serine/threonine protein kinase
MEDYTVGREIDGYHILEVLGRGGMGVVYKAEDVALGREVAIKRIDPAFARDASFLRRFRSEARALARIHSAHIVQVHALRETDIGHIIVMEYVDGGTVKDRIVGERMSPGSIVRVIRQTLTALEDAHRVGVIHRDIKPQNILLSADGQVKVTDFGLAKINQSGDRNRTVTRGVYGTLTYMSPEQVEGLGRVDHRSDLYSLGMTAYEMLAGRLPFDEDSSDYTIMRMIVEEELPTLDRFAADVPRPLQDFVATALSKDPDRRYQSASEMKDALPESAGQGEGPVTGSGLKPRQTGRNWRAKGTLSILTVVILLVAGYFGSTALFSVDPGAPPRNSPRSFGSSPPAIEQELPPVIEPLIAITEARVLRNRLVALQDDRRLRADGDSLSFFEPETCFVFVVDPGPARVAAVLGPGGSERPNLRTGAVLADWRREFDGHDFIWVAPTKR